ncbi:MAG: hypothetical protein IPO71_05740 [Nitrosomonas sp.]|nr:hypothetical protein [Nitrosomonas sp.]
MPEAIIRNLVATKLRYKPGVEQQVCQLDPSQTIAFAATSSVAFRPECQRTAGAVGIA